MSTSTVSDSYHRIDIRQTSQHLVVRSCDRVAASRRALVLYESGVRSRRYVPRADIDESFSPGAGTDNFPLYPKLHSWLRRPGPAADRAGKLSEGQDC